MNKSIELTSQQRHILHAISQTVIFSYGVCLDAYLSCASFDQTIIILDIATRTGQNVHNIAQSFMHAIHTKPPKRKSWWKHLFNLFTKIFRKWILKK